MVPELEKPRVTEIHVRIDCNGCVQKIKKALSGINGIYDLYIDFPQQKLTIIGWADPEKIVKAIKKTRKIATICSHTEASTEPSQGPPQTEQAPEGSAQQPPEASNPPPQEAPPPEAAPPAEPPQDPPPPENHPPPPPPYPVAADTNALGQPVQLPKDVGQVHVIHHHPPDYGYRYSYGHGYNGYWNKYHNGQGHPQEQQPPPPPQQQPPPPQQQQPPLPPPQQQQPPPPPPQQPQPLPPQPIYATHSYNTYRPSPYVTEYEYIRSPPRHRSYYNPIDRYNEEQYYYNNGNYNGNGNITSIFSDENPNACRIV